jgi:ferredoxin
LNKTPSRKYRNAKYLVLLFLLAAGAVGLSLGQFLDPLTILDRTFTLVFYPAASYFFALFTPLREAGFTEYFIGLGSFILILVFNYFAPRFWCRNLCPLGGLLAIGARFSLFKFTFLENCTNCGLCARVCPTAAIKDDIRMIDHAECVSCLRCAAECGHGQIGYRVNFKPAPFDIKRRQAITVLAAGVIIAPLARSLSQVRLNGRLVRPPGATPEADFSNACLRCGLCMKVCPTNGLQPCVAEAGLTGLWTPRLVPRIGGCEKN